MSEERTEALAVNTTGSHRVPDFFIAGHPKCGTTALYEMLRQHREVFIPDLKEPMFFAKDLPTIFQNPMSGPLPATLNQYLSLFDGADPNQHVGDSSAFYLVSRTAASEIANLNPRAKVIGIFREPASFLRSLHLQLFQNHNEDEPDLRRALALESERREGRQIPVKSFRPASLLYSDHVRYTEQLERFYAVLPPEQIMVLIYDDFRQDNIGTVSRVLRFLGLDASESIAPLWANPTIKLRSQSLDVAVHRFSVGGGPASRTVKSIIKIATPRSFRRFLLHIVQSKIVQRTPPPLDPQLAADIRSQYRPEVERFGAYIGRDLISLWGYEKL